MNYRDWIQGGVEAIAVGQRRDTTKAFIDLGLIVAAGAWAWLVSFGQTPDPGSQLIFLAAVVSARVPIYFAFRLHRASWQHVSRYDLLWLAGSAVLAAPVIGLILVALPRPLAPNPLPRPYLILVTEAALYLFLLSGIRILTRALIGSRRSGGGRRRILIIGAGNAGHTLAFIIQESVSEYHIVGFLDDDPLKQGRRIRGLPVLGSTADVVKAAGAHRVHQLVIAIPSLSPERLREILIACEPTALPIRILPPLRELMGGKPDPASLREVRVEDLLPRPQIKLASDLIAGYLRDRTVLVTGGGGSIGAELCRQVLAAGAACLVILDHDENGVLEIMQELAERDGKCEISPVICDVRDRAAVAEALRQYRPQAVFHAAAHKHVPFMEWYPAEAVKTNVLGTVNLVSLAAAHGVEHFVFVSTDKAVNPTSVMGATKRVAEMIVKAYASANDASMASVRFGNVLGSRGSVVEVMTRQIQRGLPVTVTDPEMVRYFMTIPEAVQLILQAGAVGGRGEIYVLDMGHPMRIMDLAHDLIRLSGLVPRQDVPIRIIGRRPGEKICEEVLTNQEAENAVRNGHFYITSCEPVDLPALLKNIEALSAAAERGSRDEIVRTLQLIVPTYRPDIVAAPAAAVRQAK